MGGQRERRQDFGNSRSFCKGVGFLIGRCPGRNRKQGQQVSGSAAQEKAGNETRPALIRPDHPFSPEREEALRFEPEPAVPVLH